jgi:hypothetical protein
MDTVLTDEWLIVMSMVELNVCWYPGARLNVTTFWRWSWVR